MGYWRSTSMCYSPRRNQVLTSLAAGVASRLISVGWAVAFVVREFLSVAAFVISLARSLSMITVPARLSSRRCFLLPHLAERNPKPNRMLEVMQPRYRMIEEPKAGGRRVSASTILSLNSISPGAAPLRRQNPVM